MYLDETCSDKTVLKYTQQKRYLSLILIMTVKQTRC